MGEVWEVRGGVSVGVWVRGVGLGAVGLPVATCQSVIFVNLSWGEFPTQGQLKFYPCEKWGRGKKF